MKILKFGVFSQVHALSWAKLMLFGLFALHLLPTEATTLDQVKNRGYLAIATEDDYAPLEMIKEGKPVGFTHDLVEELKAYAPFEIRQEIMPWTGLLPAVLAGKYDVALTGALVSPERLEHFDFSPPLIPSTHYVILRSKDNRIQTIADLSGKTLGLQAGSVLLSRLPELETLLAQTGGQLGKVVEYASYPEAYSDLANGRLDYVINAYVAAKNLTTQRPNLFKMGMAVSGPGYHAWPVPKNNPEILAFLTAFIDHLRANGKLAAIQQKWFGESMEDLPVEPITSKEQYAEMTQLAQ